MKTLKIFAGVAVLLALVGFLSGAGRQYTVEQRTHIVQADENLFSIAAQYAAQQDKASDLRELVYDIQQASGLKGETIYPGQVLTVPLATRK